MVRNGAVGNFLEHDLIPPFYFQLIPDLTKKYWFGKLFYIVLLGEGDTGDVWKVICSGDAWARDEAISFKHVDTGVFLGVSGRTFGRPIHGQMEVVGLSMPDSSTK